MRASKIFASGLLAGIIALGSGNAFAHTQWLSPSTTQAEVSTNAARPTYVTIDAGASSTVFNADHAALRLDNVEITAPDGTRSDPENKSVGKVRSVFDVKLDKEGSYRVALNGNAVFATFKVGEEVKRVRGATEEEVKKQVPADAKDVQISKSFSRVETIVVAGKPGTLKPLNTGIELFPLQPVSDFVVGEKAKFLVLKDGKPLKDTKVKVVPGGVRYRGQLGDQTLTSDAKGEITVDWKIPEKYFLSVSYPPRPDEDDDDKAPAKPAANAAAPKPAANAAAGAPAGGPPAGGPGMGMMPLPAERYSYAITVDVLPD